MYENYTQEYLLEKMLEKAREKGFPTVEGSLIYNSACLMAVMLEDAYDVAEKEDVNGWPDTCDREHLIRFGRSVGLEIVSATAAVLKAEFKGSEPETGLILTDGERNYKIILTESYDSENEIYIVILECETVGSEGNITDTSLDVVDYSDGFEYCTVIEILTLGKDEEETEAFRKRYFDFFGVPGQFGNEKFWREIALSINGIDNVRITSYDDNEGRTIVLITASGVAGQRITEEALESLNSLIHTGDSEAIEPFGQEVEIERAEEVAVELVVSVIKESDATDEDILAGIEEVTEEYLRKVNSDFGLKNLYVRRTAIEARILEVEGVEDCEIISLNGADANITLSERQIAIRGNVSVQ